MEREPIGVAGDQAGKFIWQRFFKGCFCGGAALTLLIAIYKDVQYLLSQQHSLNWLPISLIALACFLLASCLERVFFLLRLERKLHYRLSFWVAAFAPLLCAFLILIDAYWLKELNSQLEFLPIAMGAVELTAIGGSFLGCLLATIARDGFWENNSPPPLPISQSVFLIHQERLGTIHPVPYWKRLFDITVAFWGLLISLPIWLIGGFLIWYEDPGPLLFVKNSVGRGGKNFHQLKLRTMIRGAEEHTGPVISQCDDQRILVTGHFFRKTALDELPQLLNIIRGDMSFVGPRPQRTVLVYQYLQQMPEYADRHKVLPGLAGLAQVAGDYYLTPRQKLRLDRLYIQYMSLGFDIKLLFLAFLLTFWFRWRKGWNGRLPRKLIRYGG